PRSGSARPPLARGRVRLPTEATMPLRQAVVPRQHGTPGRTTEAFRRQRRWVAVAAVVGASVGAVTTLPPGLVGIGVGPGCAVRAGVGVLEIGAPFVRPAVPAVGAAARTGVATGVLTAPGRAG